VADKIRRDATMTTGAAWKSHDAGPNRILRWVMLLSDEELARYDLFISELRPGVVAKLREEEAKRGKALIETCHKNPRIHNADNVSLAHRECNIAQGSKTLDEFYAWIEGILERAGKL
jgi:hypothetical protein